MVKFAVFVLLSALAAVSVNAQINDDIAALISQLQAGGSSTAATLPQLPPQVIAQLLQILAKPPTPSPSPPSPPSPGQPAPERFRIVVVDDCKEEAKSPQECHEINVPPKRCNTLKFKISNKRQ